MSGYVSILWHHHQPLYRLAGERHHLRQPWVRLHALRDYYSMAGLVAEHPEVRLTFNLTPVLLTQLDDYVDHGATDSQLERTLASPDSLTSAERQTLLATFFEADWHHQIFVHPRYRDLFDKRSRGENFSDAEIVDLQMWFNLAWFGREFREGPVDLTTGETVRVHRFVNQQRGFSTAQVRSMVDEQYKIMEAIVPIHRTLQDRGQIEVTTTPFYHPILPLVVDSDDATVDLPGADSPMRFSYPDDARAQIRRAIEDYETRFGQKPRGMWPAEGAVSRAAVELLDESGIGWVATDQDVLRQSGRWGYQVQEPDVLHRPYGVDGIDGDLAMFFRDTSLSDAIGFRYQHETAENAAADFLEEIRTRFAGRDGDAEDNLVTVVLDGENAWGGYVEDGRPFLRSLYDRLGEARDIQTVTFSEYLNGESSRSVPSHPPERRVYELHTGSWIDEPGSEPGVDLGTWIGEPEENRAWEMLGRARRAVEVSSPGEARRSALEAVFAAEGSDWFWWLGEDQDSGDDDFFDELFRAHLRATYELLEEKPPDELDAALVRHHVVWSFTRPVDEVRPDSHFVVRTNCPGTLRWWSDVTEATEASLHPVGGVLAGSRRFQAAVGRIRDSWSRLHFQFLCAEPDCPRRDECCRGAVQTVEIAAERFID